MIEAVSAIVQVLLAAISFGGLVLLTVAYRARTGRVRRQPLPIPVERDPRD